MTPSEQHSSSQMPWSKRLLLGLGPKFKEVPILGDQGHSAPVPPERELSQTQWVTRSQRLLPFCARDASLELLVRLAPLLIDLRLPSTSLGRVAHAQHQQHPGSLEMQSPSLTSDLRSHNMHINKMLGNPQAKKKKLDLRVGRAEKWQK